MSTANPMEVMVGGNHYLKYKIQPTEFWIRTQLPGDQAAIVKYLTRHGDKAGRQDVEKCIDFVQKMQWWYFDVDWRQRARPLHRDYQGNYAITPEQYCIENQLPAQETAAIMLVTKFTCREHLDAAIDAMREVIARDYATSQPEPVTINLDQRDLMYLAKEQLGRYLSVLESVRALPEQIGRLKALIDRIQREWRL